MKLRKKSWLFKFAYSLTNKQKVPKETSLCKLFWRCLFMCICWPLAVVIILIVSIIAFLLGERIRGLKQTDPEESLDPNNPDYPFMPFPVPTIYGLRIWPIWPMLGLCLAVFFTKVFFIGCGVVLLVIIAILGIYGFYLVMKSFLKSNFWHGFCQMMKKLHAFICPRIEIED